MLRFVKMVWYQERTTHTAGFDCAGKTRCRLILFLIRIFKDELESNTR